MIKSRKARKSFTEQSESGCTGIHSWQGISDRVSEAGWGGAEQKTVLQTKSTIEFMDKYITAAVL